MTRSRKQTGETGEAVVEKAKEAPEEEDASVTSISKEDEGGVIQIVNLILARAVKAKASDIHIEPYQKLLRVRYRIDGVLHEQPAPPKKFLNAIVSRIKIMADLDIAERRRPAGRPHQGQDRRQGDRLARLDLPLRPRREDRHAHPGLVRPCSLDISQLGMEPENFAILHQARRGPLRHHPGHRAHRLGQIDHALFDAAHAQCARRRTS